MPDLSLHFDTLDLTSDIFLIDYMLTLFAKSMDVGMVARIVDNFLLEGEIFVVKAAIGILKVMERDFLK